MVQECLRHGKCCPQRMWEWCYLSKDGSKGSSGLHLEQTPLVFLWSIHGYWWPRALNGPAVSASDSEACEDTPNGLVPRSMWCSSPRQPNQCLWPRFLGRTCPVITCCPFPYAIILLREPLWVQQWTNSPAVNLTDSNYLWNAKLFPLTGGFYPPRQAAHELQSTWA